MVDHTVTAPKKRSHLDVIGGNAFWSLLRYASSWIALLCLPPFLMRHLSGQEYATWMLLLQFGSYVTFFDSSMQTAVARYVGRADGAQDREYLQRILASVLLLLVLGAAIALIVTWAFAAYIGGIFPKIPPSLLPSARISLLVIGTSICISLPFTTLVGGFLGLQRNRVITSALVSAKVLSSLGMAWAAHRGGSIVALACWFSAGVLFPPMFYVVEWLGAREELPIHPRKASLGLTREFLAFYAILAANTLAAIFISGLDLPIVARFNFAAVGLYSLATIFGNMLLIPQGALVSVVMPAAAGLSASRSPKELGYALHKFARYASASMAALAAGLSLGAPIFLRVWLGPALEIKILPLALTLLAAQIIMLTAEPYQVMVLATGKQSKLLPAWILSALVNVVASILLARRFGAIGVAGGTLIGSIAGLLAQFFISMPLTDTIQFERRLYLRATLIEPLIACIPAAMLGLLLWKSHLDLRISGLSVAMAVPLAIAIMLYRTFSPTERAELLTVLRLKKSSSPSVSAK